MITINTNTWYTERKLNFTPKHFIRSTTMLSTDSLAWIYEVCTGRFSIEGDRFSIARYPCFEDPKEAVFYELRWG